MRWTASRRPGAGSLPPAAGHWPTLIDDYISQKERLGLAKPETCVDQRERVRWFLNDYLEDDIGTLTPKKQMGSVSRHRAAPKQKTGKQMAAASHRHYLALTKGFFLWAVREGHVEHSPFKEVQPIGRVSAGKPQLRIEEAKLFVDEALRRFDQHADVLALGSAVALLMGLRAGEVLRRQAATWIAAVRSSGSTPARRATPAASWMCPRSFSLV